jgi:cell division protein FtsN
MNQTGADSGNEFVLDNRKLIITFLVLVFVCGAFFVIGFMEGKRQAVPTRVERNPSDSIAGTGAEARGPDTKAAGRPTESKPIEDQSGRAQLDWYRNTQGKESGTQKPSEAAKAAKTVKSKPIPPAKKPAVSQPQVTKQTPITEAGSMVPAANVTYTVQVGAFKQRQEADIRAAALKAKGYVCVIDFKPIEQLYLVKVGKFDTRADAKAVQLQLSKNGFSSFIKVN